MACAQHALNLSWTAACSVGAGDVRHGRGARLRPPSASPPGQAQPQIHALCPPEPLAVPERKQNRCTHQRPNATDVEQNGKPVWEARFQGELTTRRLEDHHLAPRTRLGSRFVGAMQCAKLSGHGAVRARLPLLHPSFAAAVARVFLLALGVGNDVLGLAVPLPVLRLQEDTAHDQAYGARHQQEDALPDELQDAVGRVSDASPHDSCRYCRLTQNKLYLLARYSRCCESFMLSSLRSGLDRCGCVKINLTLRQDPGYAMHPRFILYHADRKGAMVARSSNNLNNRDKTDAAVSTLPGVVVATLNTDSTTLNNEYL